MTITFTPRPSESGRDVTRTSSAPSVCMTVSTTVSSSGTEERKSSSLGMLLKIRCMRL